MNDRGTKGNLLQGMILAAGYGTRLAPVTDHIPKPLLPMGNGTLLDKIIEGMSLAGVGDIAVNTHHLGEQISQHLTFRSDASRFFIFPEEDILGTGGALDGARSFLEKGDHFLLHNGDVLSDIDLADLVRVHEENNALATLALADWPAVNSVIMANGPRDCSTIMAIAQMPEPLPASAGRSLTYTGIGVFSRKLLADIEPGFSSIITPLVKAMVTDPGCVQGYAPELLQWDDLGTLARWLKAWEKHQPGQGESNARLKVSRLTGHGSDRKFWRLGSGKWSAIVVMNPQVEDHSSRGLGADPLDEFSYFTAIGRFLNKHGLGAPAFLSVDEEAQIALMEDLGPISLYSEAMTPDGQPGRVKEIYQRVIDQLVCLQEHTSKAMQECPEAVNRCLDESMLRWETDYFRDNYLISHLGLEKKNVASLDQVFQQLASRVSRQPKVLLHRDFQSQNIMLTHGKPRLVDFQGMRLGPLGYDIMSLAFDPYVDLAMSDRWELVDYYAHRISQSKQLASFPGSLPDKADLLDMATEAGLQRLMQALGAYTFLGHVKGKSEFLAHIPRAGALLAALLDRHLSRHETMTDLRDLLI